MEKYTSDLYTKLYEALEASQVAMIEISQVLGLAEQGMSSLPYILKKPKNSIDLQIIKNSSCLNSLKNSNEL